MIELPIASKDKHVVYSIGLCLTVNQWKLLNFGRDYHCVLIGYQVKKKHPPQRPKQNFSLGVAHGKTKPVKLSQSSPVGNNAKVSSATGKVFGLFTNLG